MIPFSILIPTYNRLEKLCKVLDVLANQEGISEGEIIVGIDGSQDGTEEYLKRKTQNVKNLSYFAIEHSGRAVIRNRLLDEAQGELIIFIQDDIVVTEGWLQAHLKAHAGKRGAIVGDVTWYPEMKITPYMKWLENGGHMLNFSGLRDGDEMDFWHFYMGNISFPRELVDELRFDQDYQVYGWEDIVFGYKFVLAGGRVYYSSPAKAYHWDEYQEENLREYMERVGRSAVLVEKKYPGVGFVPPSWKKFIFYVLIFLGKIFRPILPQSWKWYLDMKRWFLAVVK